MEGKNSRSIDKRKMMKKNKHNQLHEVHKTTSSSSPPPQRAIADVADSSDERFIQKGNRWKPAQQDRCFDLDELDTFDELNDAHKQLRAGDFTAMSQLPNASGGHFKFSSEKNWDAANDGDTELLKSTEAGEYFTLNLKLLNSGLKTIPFHKRMDYPSSIFTNNELAAMEKSAEEAEEIYQNIILHKKDDNPTINISNGSVKEGSVKSVKPEGAASVVNEIVKSTEAIDLKEDATSPTQGNNNDIQDWLDNVLDEGN